MLMDAYGREGGVKNPKNHAYVIYGCPHIKFDIDFKIDFSQGVNDTILEE